MIPRAIPLLFTALLLSNPSPGQKPRTDTVNVGLERQIMENFGAFDCWSMQKLGLWSQPARERVADLLFSQTKGAGLSCWRFNIGGGINPKIGNPWRTAETFEVTEGKYDWSRQAGERWFLAAAKERSVPQFLAFVNSPPGRMTRNGITFTTQGLGTTNLKPGFERSSSAFICASGFSPLIRCSGAFPRFLRAMPRIRSTSRPYEERISTSTNLTWRFVSVPGPGPSGARPLRRHLVHGAFFPDPNLLDELLSVQCGGVLALKSLPGVPAAGTGSASSFRIQLPSNAVHIESSLASIEGEAVGTVVLARGSIISEAGETASESVRHRK